MLGNSFIGRDRPDSDGGAMAFVGGFAPWILYWILLGNVDFRLAVCLSLALAVVFQVIARIRRQPWRSLDVGSLIIFFLLAVAAFVVSDAFLAQWLQPLSNLGLFAVALIGVLIGRPFVQEYAADTVDAETARTDGFRYITTAMTWLWVVAFALMTIISALPPLVDGSAVINDEFSTLSILCYWVLPYTLLGLAAAVSMFFPKWFDRKTAEIDKRETAEAPTVAPPAAAPSDEASGSLSIEAAAETGHDDPLPIRVRGVAAGQSVEVSVSGPDLFGRHWQSRASFGVTSDHGLDTAADAPSAGDWSGNDATAPVWAMQFAEPKRTPDLFVPPVDPWLVTIRAEVPGLGSAQHTVQRRGAAPGVHTQSVEIGGQPGLLARPAGPPPEKGWPAVACFGGSEGGFESQTGHALLLASHGYAALAACWLPGGEAAGLASVPLERFGTLLEWLGAQHDVDADRMTAMAVSRGAEGLLAALTRDDAVTCRGLVLVSPSSLTWQAMGSEGSIPDTGAWTWRGQPTPWLRIPTGALMPQIIRNAWRIGRDTAAHRPTLLTLRPAYEAGLREGETNGGDPRIDASRLACPLLLLTGGADAVWPSERMAQDLLAARPATARDEHQHYPGAGHLIRLGVLPTDAQWTGGITLGGTRPDQAAAQQDATTRVLRFLGQVTQVSDSQIASVVAPGGLQGRRIETHPSNGDLGEKRVEKQQ